MSARSGSVMLVALALARLAIWLGFATLLAVAKDDVVRVKSAAEEAACEDRDPVAWQSVRVDDGSELRVPIGESPAQAVAEALELCADLRVDGDQCDMLVATIWEKAVISNLQHLAAPHRDTSILEQDIVQEQRALKAELHHARDRLARALRSKRELESRLAHARRAAEPTLSAAQARIIPMPVRDAANLSVSEFHTSFVSPGIPVILRGLDALFESFASPEAIREKCSLKGVRLKRVSDNATSWAKLERVATVDVDTFFSTLEGSDLYLHDEPIERICPELLSSFRVPAYFAEDLLQRVPSWLSPFWANFRDYWPSVFVSGSNSGSGLHADWCSSSAWMAVTHGQKHWRIVPQHMRNLLAEDVMNPGTFHESLFLAEPQTTLPAVDIFDALVGPGDVIFIPSGAPHQVQNRGVTVAVAMNMVLREDLPVFMSALADQAAVSPHSTHAQLLPVLARLQREASIMAPLGTSSEADNGEASVSLDQFKSPTS
ncbi:Bifunctional arginine demethylase and lysyl-hydroxylase JMJD6 [Hondaea fermentalgiana]|uniref:Bifunctional arginine demethylase and lysyl-hydroxylase JMJD6 n=1 Tax=Hondaea fermentalgiana TaxID=2315210 RepID=A0A2R5GAZ0_9STRA|nr:Bifunctional arginine demethylase and lysyl-hydroxylase JMJD6 [Hondaea fermentalgiana]|eukprot:GBG28170.1 Bifunctional arginine demethylase and lysyl-hydroxylase JMJD6 [Hondaea fermentalgiana]